MNEWGGTNTNERLNSFWVVECMRVRACMQCAVDESERGIQIRTSTIFSIHAYIYIHKNIPKVKLWQAWNQTKVESESKRIECAHWHRYYTAAIALLFIELYSILSIFFSSHKSVCTRFHFYSVLPSSLSAIIITFCHFVFNRVWIDICNGRYFFRRYHCGRTNNLERPLMKMHKSEKKLQKYVVFISLMNWHQIPNGQAIYKCFEK